MNYSLQEIAVKRKTLNLKGQLPNWLTFVNFPIILDLFSILFSTCVYEISKAIVSEKKKNSVDVIDVRICRIWFFCICVLRTAIQINIPSLVIFAL